MASPVIVVDQPAPLFDATVAIEVRGFPARQPVTITAIQMYPNMSRWQGRATFMSDDEGCVYVARQAPISGTYDGVSAMGLIWSAELLPGQTRTPPPGSIMQPKPVQLEATSPDGTHAELMLERHVAAPGVTRTLIRTEGIVGTLFLPPNDGPHPAVVVLNGGDGGIDEYRGALLASHGYAALNLGYFGMDGLPRGLVNIPLEYFENAIRWMRRQPWLGDHFLAVWGESRGGELALLLGATFPEINAIIAWVYQHGNAPRRGRSPRGLRVVLPRSAARQQRCGARDDPGGENAGAHSACVGNRRSHVAVHGTPRDD